MILSLLKQVGEDAKVKVKDAGVIEADKQDKLGKALANDMAEHVKRLKETIDKDVEKLAQEEKEQKKHITSEDLHDGFDSKVSLSFSDLSTRYSNGLQYIPPKAEPPPVPVTKIDKGKRKDVTTEFEVLNPKAVSPPDNKNDPELDDDDDDEDALPELTPSLELFSKIPLKAYEKSFEYIQSHRDVIVPGAADALLVAAFRAQSNGKPKYAKQCVHQSLLLQYCEKLGGDGVRVFFRK